MREFRGVLQALLQRKIWERYGNLVQTLFTSPGASPLHKKLYKIVENHWQTAVPEGEHLSYDLLGTYAEQVSTDPDEALELHREIAAVEGQQLGPDVEKLLAYAINNHTLGNILVETHRELIQKGQVDIASVVDKLEEVERGLISTDTLEIFSPTAVEEIIGDEVDCRKYPTGHPSMDDMLGGGLWDNELGVLLGETFIGKTWALTYLGAQALRAGIPVIHFTGEITRRRSYIRYWQSLLRQERSYVMKNPTFVGEYMARLDLPPWTIVDFSSRAYNTHQLRQDVLRFCDMVDTPPLIIVDYIDKLKSGNRTLQERFALNDITEYLRRIACEVNGGLWSASQVGRVAYGGMHVRKENVAEAIGKVEIADVIVALNQSKQEREFGQMRWSIEKARERMLPYMPEVALKCEPQFQSFVEDGDLNQTAFEEWVKTK